MSEYQYYEFQAVDRPLTRDELREVRAVSTRAEITPTRFSNEYSWGDFKGNPAKWMERYYDAFLYLANWGTREVMLRLPAGALDPEVARRYCAGEYAKAEVRGEWLILTFRSEEEGGDEEWLEPEGILASIRPVRDELASGDLRPLYLAWLAHAWMDEEEYEEYEEDDDAAAGGLEPPVPPGLGKLTHAQRAFADFLRVGPDLIAAAAERSAAPPAEADARELRAWIGTLPAAHAADLLARVASGEGPRVREELLRGFRDARPDAGAEPEPRTLAELMKAAARQRDSRLRREREEERRSRERQARKEAAERERRLAELAGREAEAWARAEALVRETKAASYDEAVRIIGDLRELAARAGKAEEADGRIRGLREQYRQKRGFVQRLDALPAS